MIFDTVMWYRPVTLREFVNYVKAMGRYVTYGEAMRAVSAVFDAVGAFLPEHDLAMARSLLPEALRPVWDDSAAKRQVASPWVRTETRQKSSATGASLPLPDVRIQPRKNRGAHGLIERVREAGEYSSPAQGTVALSAVFGALKEKLRDAADAWSQLVPEEGRKVWEKALTVDQLQDVSQCV